MAKQELGPLQLKWIEALESGRYRQGKSALCYDGAFCCLGVACEILEVRRREVEGEVLYGEAAHGSYAPREVVDGLGLANLKGSLFGTLRDHASLAEANDNGVTFTDIAAFCRKRPEAVFVAVK